MKLRSIIVITLILATALIVVLGWKPISAAVYRFVTPLKFTDGLVGYWSFDGENMDWSQTTAEARDESGQGNHGNVTNFGTEAARAGVVGQALSFDGTNDQISISTGTNGILAKLNNSSICAWVNPNTLSGTDQVIYGEQISTGVVYLLETNSSVMRYGVHNGTTWSFSTGATALTTGQWYFFCGTYSSTAGTIGYLNGVSDGSSGTTGTNSNDVTNIDIGMRSKSTATNYFPGSIDEVRVYNRALSAGEIKTMYDRTKPGGQRVIKTPLKFADNLVGYWSFDGENMDWAQTSAEARDESGNGNHGDVTNFGTEAARAGIVGQALDFDGVNDYVDITDISLTNFTVTGWIKMGGSTGDIQTLISMEDVIGQYYRFDISTSNNISLYNLGGIAYNIGSTALSRGRWYHIVGTRSGTVSTFFVDGVQTGSTDTGALTTIAGSNGLIGTRNGGGVEFQYYFNGLIDEVRIYNVALSASQIKQLYNSSAPEFRSKMNMSQTDFMKDGLVGFWSFDGKYMDWAQTSAEARDSSGQGNHGNVTNFGTEAARPGIVGQALSLDGVNDNIDMGNDSDFSFGTGNFTMSAWIKPSRLNNNTDAIMGKYQTTGYFTSLNTGALPMIFLSDGSGGYLWNTIGTTIAPIGQWTYLVITVNRTSNAIAYLNGVQTGTLDISAESGSLDTSSSFYIGREIPDSSYFHGSIDEVRIYNRALSAGEVLQLYNGSRK